MVGSLVPFAAVGPGTRQEADKVALLHSARGLSTLFPVREQIDRSPRPSERKQGRCMKMLIADPDAEWVTLLAYWLRSHGHTPLLAHTHRDALQLWSEHAPALALVDLALSGGSDRTAFCRQLRAAGRGSILVLTDPLLGDEEADALEQGADVYLRKPISMRRVQAHINALLRRKHGIPGTLESSQLKIGPISVNLTHYEVRRQGRSSRLTPIEGRLLHFLLANAGQVLPQGTILQHIWGLDGHAPNLLKTHIHHLRQKIEPDPRQPRFLVTIPTVGYVLYLADPRANAAPLEGVEAPVRHAPVPAEVG